MAQAEQRLEALATHRALVTPRINGRCARQRLDELQENVWLSYCPATCKRRKTAMAATAPATGAITSPISAPCSNNCRSSKAAWANPCSVKCAIAMGIRPSGGPIGCPLSAGGDLPRLRRASPMAMGKLVRDSQQVTGGRCISARLNEGIIHATVTDCRKRPRARSLRHLPSRAQNQTSRRIFMSKQPHIRNYHPDMATAALGKPSSSSR